ncbi:MAG: type II toxin-antitoxin system PemK/MazF family toxin [Chloroflexi bacterium]|nr:type II toxin-antitoxin system PemK/MazF family toxin [Chloroflexota bacterium]
MNRGDIHWVDLDPVVGSEAGRQRPAIVVSNDGANMTAARLGRGVVTIVPITSNVERVYPFQVRIPAGEGGLSRDSKAQAEQVRSVAYARMGTRLGTVSGETMERIDTALRLHLAL